MAPFHASARYERPAHRGARRAVCSLHPRGHFAAHLSCAPGPRSCVQSGGDPEDKPPAPPPLPFPLPRVHNTPTGHPPLREPASLAQAPRRPALLSRPSSVRFGTSSAPRRWNPRSVEGAGVYDPSRVSVRRSAVHLIRSPRGRARRRRCLVGAPDLRGGRRRVPGHAPRKTGNGKREEREKKKRPGEYSKAEALGGGRDRKHSSLLVGHAARRTSDASPVRAYVCTYGGGGTCMRGRVSRWGALRRLLLLLVRPAGASSASATVRTISCARWLGTARRLVAGRPVVRPVITPQRVIPGCGCPLWPTGRRKKDRSGGGWPWTPRTVAARRVCSGKTVWVQEHQRPAPPTTKGDPWPQGDRVRSCGRTPVLFHHAVGRRRGFRRSAQRLARGEKQPHRHRVLASSPRAHARTHELAPGQGGSRGRVGGAHSTAPTRRAGVDPEAVSWTCVWPAMQVHPALRASEARRPSPRAPPPPPPLLPPEPATLGSYVRSPGLKPCGPSGSGQAMR